MNSRTRTLTLSAVLTALSIVFLFLATIIPTSRLGIVAVSSLFAIAAIIETGIISSIFVFIGTSIIGLLILPDKTTVLIYVLFFGYYPLIKSLAERLRPIILQWLVKLAVFNAALSVVWFLLKNLIFSGTLLETSVLVIYLAGNLVFVIFDIGLTKLISFYIVRISKNLRKNNR